MKNRKRFERILPPGYREVYRLDATTSKIGLLFNLIGLAMMVAVFVVGCIPIWMRGEKIFLHYGILLLPAILLGVLITIPYMVLHELVHGFAYRALTGEKLKFGITRSCAFCGVPHVYTYRRTASVAVILPFLIFSILLICMTVVFFFTSSFLYFVFLTVFCCHFGGCCGDLYVFLLLHLKFRSRELLMQDTGPAQTFYLPKNEKIDF